VSGRLFVVATPLGNLDDVSRRARETLEQVDCIACEDTRRTARLLARFGLQTPMISCHKFNEKERLEPILDRLGRGEDVALVSDGGTPGVSDPGSLLIAAALERGLAVVPLPGPSAVATLLSVSGLPGDRYVFEGYLPHRAGERRRRLRELRPEGRTLVLFEAPHRILETLDDLGQVFGARPMVLGRELTKLHESILRGTAAEIRARLEEPVRGEITLAVAGDSGKRGAEPLDRAATELLRAWRESLEQTAGDRRKALREVARTLGIGRSELYRRLAELGEDPAGPSDRRHRPRDAD